MKNRQNKILEMLSEQNKIEVTTLSKTLGVSQVTIRKDLDALESQGIIKREHGFAHLISSDDINGRMAYHYEEKRNIAKLASQLVKDGDTLMIESGSCCALLADELTKTKKDLTIITNSAFIASFIRRKCNFQIFLLGGIYQQDTQVMVGPMVRQGAKNFFVQNFFIGTDGYSAQIGFTNKDQMRAQAVQDMASQANHVIVLTESDKFTKLGVVPLNLKEKIKTVITDSNIDKTIKSQFMSNGIDVQCIETQK